jgi:WD40 repeat protein
VPQRTLLSPDGKWLAVYFKHKHARHPSDAVHVWELATGRKKAVLETSVYRDWKFSHDSTMLAMTALADVGKLTQRAVADVWAGNGSGRLRVIEVPRAWQGAFTLSFAPNDKLLAIGGRYRFGIFSVRTGKLITEEHHSGEHFSAGNTIVFDVSHVEFSPDGRFLLTGGNNGIVRLWSFGDGAV